MCPSKLLVVDDDPATTMLLRERLEEDGHQCLLAGAAHEAFEAFQTGVHAVLVDYELPDANGFELVNRIRRMDASVPVVMITGHAGIDHAVRGMKLGLFDYIAKPIDLDRMSEAVSRALLHQAALQEEHEALEALDGASPAMVRLRRVLSRAAQSRGASVLLTGETGTGKGVAARALHRASSRRDGPFMNVTCTSLSSSLLESELFGHERGAFTDAKSLKQGLFELADGGTLFLDEIGDLEAPLQAKLLRVLEERSFRRVGGTRELQADFRLVAATHVDLHEAVRERSFREDLYYRLAVLVIDIPPLRDRGDDIVLLARRFLARLCQVEGRAVPQIDAEGVRLLRSHPWPGNVRELRNAMERALFLTDEGQRLNLGWLMDEPELDREPSSSSRSLTLPDEGVDMRELERALVEQALERTGGNVTRAASLLGMNRDQMRYRVSKFGLEVR